MRTTKRRPVAPIAGMFIMLVLVFPGLSGAQAPAAPMPTPFNPNRIPPQYPIPYGVAAINDITRTMTGVLDYLDATTPMRVINRKTGKAIADFRNIDLDSMPEYGEYWLITYEWGVTYSGMLLAAEVTGDRRFADYTGQRLQFLARLAPIYRAQMDAAAGDVRRNPLRSVLKPGSLDDSGSMCAAMIKAHRAGVAPDVRPLIDNYINYISTEQFRLEDGTLARSRPQPKTLWLDDLYMSVPALAQMGKLTGERRYYDDAVKQILQFAKRMFVREKGLYMHGWTESMEVHPAFHWARANGWAIMAKTELLDVLPEDHPGRAAVIELLRAHIRGLAACQSGRGLWHQLLDRNDSYLETSASAMFVYCIARAINGGWIDPVAYAPMAQIGWNAITTKVNAQGHVEDTCIGTGMGFDPVFYYYRPTSHRAAHGYGPVLLAGAEMIRLQKERTLDINDSTVQYRGRREK